MTGLKYPSFQRSGRFCTLHRLHSATMTAVWERMLFRD